MRQQYIRAVCALIWALYCSSFARSAGAQREPTLHVRASTRIELHAQAGANQIRISGRLIDDLDQPLVGRSVLLTLTAADDTIASDPPSRMLRTDSSGRFVQQLTRGTGRYTLRARYAGDPLHEPGEISQTFDVMRSGVQLQLVLPQGHVVSLDEASADFEVRATSEASVEGLILSLKDETGRTLANGGTDSQGVWRSAMPTSELGDPGPGEWTVTSVPDAERAAGSGVVRVVRQRATTLELEAAYDLDAAGVRVRGSLATKVAPLPRAAIGIYLDGEHAHTLLTDARGQFDRVLPLEAGIEPMTRHIAARFDSDRPGLGSSRSADRTLTIPPRPGPNLLWIVVPSLASIVLSWLLLRRSGSLLGTRNGTPSNQAGVQLGAARQRAATQYEMDGVIEDADTAVRLSRATLRVARSDGLLIAAQVHRDGSFSIPTLDPGTYRVEARAPGYAVEASEVRVPHSGEGRGLRVRLRSLRTLALEAHRPLLRRVFPTREQQHTATARETMQKAPSVWPKPAIEQLTAMVEHSAYGVDEPTVDEVRAIEGKARELEGPGGT